MSDSHTNFSADRFSAGAGTAMFAGASAVAGAILAERDRMQADADARATDDALASWQALVDQLTHANVTLREVVAQRDEANMILEAENATLAQRLADAGL